MKIWFKLLKNHHILKDVTITDDSDDTRTHKIFRSLEEACHQMDVGVPIWLDANIREFKRFSKVRFSRDSFIEELRADYFEMEVLEED